MEFDSEKMRKGLKDSFVNALAKAVKETAQDGQWSASVRELSEESSVDDVAKAALESAMAQFRGASTGVPQWFSGCVSAVRSILAVDEIEGLECAAALYMATDRASAVQRMAALQQLLQVLDPDGVPSMGFGLFGT